MSQKSARYKRKNCMNARDTSYVRKVISNLYQKRNDASVPKISRRQIVPPVTKNMAANINIVSSRQTSDNHQRTYQLNIVSGKSIYPQTRSNSLLGSPKRPTKRVIRHNSSVRPREALCRTEVSINSDKSQTIIQGTSTPLKLYEQASVYMNRCRTDKKPEYRNAAPARVISHEYEMSSAFDYDRVPNT
jgi:hypothetical protein